MKQNKIHICLIAHYFFPYNNVAANRINAFAKYLPKDKYLVSVLTIKRTDSEKAYSIEFDGVHVHRIETSGLIKPASFETKTNKLVHSLKVVKNKLVHKLSNPDKGWMKKGNEKFKEIDQKEHVHLIISSFAPVSSHILALNIKQDRPDIKWIADMRDEMSANPFIEESLKKHYKEVEEQVAGKADVITSVSQPILDDFKDIMKGSQAQFKLLRNGYDHERIPDSTFQKEFTISYVGTFYGVRKPHTFFNALENIISSEDDFTCRLNFIGTPNNFSIPKSIQPMINWVGKVSNQDAVGYMFNSDVNLLVHPKTAVKGIYTGKLFEYLSAQKPILALVDTEDVAAELIAECSAGFIADFYNIAQIEAHILSLYKLWKQKETLNFDKERIAKLHRRYGVQKLDQIISSILE